MEVRSQTVWLWLALALASLAAVGMFAARMVYSGQITFVFLLWNLFLAWLPLVFAWILVRAPHTAVISGPLWLLFLPNAPYIVTDLIHLRLHTMVPIWYDTMMLFTFALTGLLLGLVSLYLVHVQVERRLGQLPGWLFVALVLSLSSYGVYIGRFLRWNSWDIFTQPLTLFNDMLHSLVAPELFLRTWTMTALLTCVLAFAYLVFYTLPRVQLEPRQR